MSLVLNALLTMLLPVDCANSCTFDAFQLRTRTSCGLLQPRVLANQVSLRSLGSGKASTWPQTGPRFWGSRVPKLPASSGATAMAPSSGGDDRHAVRLHTLTLSSGRDGSSVGCRYEKMMKKALAAMEAALATGLSSSPAAARRHPLAFEWVQARDGAMFRLQSEAMMLWKEIVSGKARLQSLAGKPAGNTAMEAEKLFLQECQLWCGLGLPFSHLWGHGACDACGFQHMLQDALSRGEDSASTKAVGCAGGEDEVKMKDAINGFVQEPIHRENQEPFKPEGWASSSPSSRELLWMAGGDGGDEDLEYCDLWQATGVIAHSCPSFLCGEGTQGPARSQTAREGDPRTRTG